MSNNTWLAYATQSSLRCQVSGWYFDPSLLSSDVLKKAHEEADKILKRELSPAEYKDIVSSYHLNSDPATPSGTKLSFTGSTMDSFLLTLQQVQQTYAQSHHSKARRWLTTFADRVVYYGNILDVLVQHHPEYVSLAWGTFKILFVSAQNHATTLAKLSKSLATLSFLLPQSSLTLILYPTPSLLHSLATIYALILRFLLESLQFYRSSRLQHAVDSVFKPWKLRFQDLYDEISSHTQQLKDMASLAAKAELRDMHLGLAESRKMLDDVDGRLMGVQSAQTRLETLIQSKVMEQTTLLSSLYTSLRLDLSTQTQALDQIHTNQLLSLSLWQHLPSSGESLEYCLSMRTRRRAWSAVITPREAELQAWAQQPCSSVFVVSSANKIVQKDFITDMARLLRDQGFPVLWALRFANHWDLDLTLVDMVRMLVLQALQVKPTTPRSEPVANRSTATGTQAVVPSARFSTTLSHLREAASLDDWLSILQQVCRDVPRLFILLDGGLLSQTTQYDRQEAMLLVERLLRKLNTSVKILIPISSLSRDHIDRFQAQNNCVILAADEAAAYGRGSRSPRVIKRKAYAAANRSAKRSRI